MWLQRGYVLSEVVLSFWRDLGFVLGLGLLSSPVALPAAKQGADYSFCAPQLKSKSSCNLESSHERTVAQRKTSVKGSLQMRQKRSLTKNCGALYILCSMPCTQRRCSALHQHCPNYGNCSSVCAAGQQHFVCFAPSCSAFLLRLQGHTGAGRCKGCISEPHSHHWGLFLRQKRQEITGIIEL